MADRESALHGLAASLAGLGYPPLAIDHSYLDWDDLPIWDGIVRAYLAKAPQWPSLSDGREAYLAGIAEAIRDGAESQAQKALSWPSSGGLWARR